MVTGVVHVETDTTQAEHSSVVVATVAILIMRLPAALLCCSTTQVVQVGRETVVPQSTSTVTVDVLVRVMVEVHDELGTGRILAVLVAVRDSMDVEVGVADEMIEDDEVDETATTAVVVMTDCAAAEASSELNANKHVNVAFILKMCSATI